MWGRSPDTLLSVLYFFSVQHLLMSASRGEQVPTSLDCTSCFNLFSHLLPGPFPSVGSGGSMWVDHSQVRRTEGLGASRIWMEHCLSFLTREGHSQETVIEWESVVASS